MDALIAEKVMGLFPCSDPIGRCDGAHTTPIQCWASKKGAGGSELAAYSTDIAAAWEVAQKIVDMDEDNIFNVQLSPSKFEECEVEVRYWDASDPNDPVLAGPFYLLGKTAPHAICLAALKAVGVEA